MDPLIAGLEGQLDNLEDRAKVPFLKLTPGQIVPIRVLKFKPIVFIEHYLYVGGKVRSFPCSKTTDPNGRCLGCYLALHNKGKQRTVAVYQVLDLRKVHYLRTDQGEQEITCTSDPRFGVQCTYCQQGMKVYYAGKKAWKLGPGYARIFLQQWCRSRLMCRNCKQGNIQVLDIYCPECKSRIFSPEDLRSKDPVYLAKLAAVPHTCPYCHKQVVFQEVIRCSNCGDNAERASISDMLLEVQAIKSDNYNQLIIENKGFAPELPPNLQREISEPIKGIENYFKPPSIQQQCNLWGVTNPFESPKEHVEPYPEQTLPPHPAAGGDTLPEYPAGRDTLPEYPVSNIPVDVPVKTSDITVNFPEDEGDL